LTAGVSTRVPGRPPCVKPDGEQRVGLGDGRAYLDIQIVSASIQEIGGGLSASQRHHAPRHAFDHRPGRLPADDQDDGRGDYAAEKRRQAKLQVERRARNSRSVVTMNEILFSSARVITTSPLAPTGADAASRKRRSTIGRAISPPIPPDLSERRHGTRETPRAVRRVSKSLLLLACRR
jgi:hypothetical protein